MRPKFMAFLLLFLLTLSGCASRAALGPGEAPPQPEKELFPYFDTHTHLLAHYGSREGPPQVDFYGAAQVALAEMDRLGIKKTLVMPPPFPPDHPHRHDVEDFIDTLRKYPDRFGFLGGGGSLNPMIQEALHDGETSPELRRRFEKKALEILSEGALGFGELTAEHFSFHQGHPYEAAPPDHPLFLLLADIAAREGVPIDIHMEAVPREMPPPKRLSSPPNPKMLRPNIAAFERLLAHNRKAKIIWAHVGWDNTGERTPALCGELLAKHPNLYMSIKIRRRGGRPETRPISKEGKIKPEWLSLIRAFPDRFLIGSDQFYFSPRVPEGSPLGAAERSNAAKGGEVFLSLLPPELARKVGYENPARVFGLE